MNTSSLAKPVEPMFSRRFLFWLIIPLVAEQFLAITIGLVDTMMVATVGEAAVSAVSIIDSITQLIVQLFASFATGGAVIASQYLGRKNYPAANDAAKQLFNLSLGVAILLLVLCMPVRKGIILTVFGSLEDTVLINSTTYFKYILLSLPFLATYNACAALFRSMGNSKVPLMVSALMNATNIAGNAYFIFSLNMGVAGAGLSTLLSRILSFLIMTILICNKKNIIHIEKITKLSWNWNSVKKILTIGIPTGIEGSIFHIGKLMVQSFVASFGTFSLAANAIANSVATMSNIPGRAINLSSITIVGQSLGAKQPKQADYYGRRLLMLSYGATLGVTLPIFLFAPHIIAVFMLSSQASSLAITIIRTTMVATSLFWPMAFTTSNILKAAGDVKYTMVISMISMWTFRVCGSYLLAFTFGLGVFGVWFGMYVDWIFRSIFYFYRFIQGKWKQIRVI